MDELKVQTGVHIQRELLLYTNCEATETVSYNFVAAICHEGGKADGGHNVVMALHNEKFIRTSDKVTILGIQILLVKSFLFLKTLLCMTVCLKRQT